MVFSWDDAVAGLAGGFMIGLAAALMLLVNGRIAGISGILAGLVPGRERAENIAFVAGLAGVPLLYAGLASPPGIGILSQPWTIMAGGVMVGVGTRLGAGCTSGHGVCGLSRLSPRSAVATAVFMGVAAAMTGVLRPYLVGG